MCGAAMTSVRTEALSFVKSTVVDTRNGTEIAEYEKEGVDARAKQSRSSLGHTSLLFAESPLTYH
jgi:hypothetical protein